MSGTVDGGAKARNTIYRLQGINFYRNIGKIGGSRKVPKGFALNRELASEAGKKGGSKSRRGKTLQA